MALPFLPGLLGDISNNLSEMDYYLAYFAARLDQAGVSGQGGDVVALGGALRTASSILLDFKDYFQDHEGGDYNFCRNVRMSIYYINKYATMYSAEITMDAILTSMTAASFEQLTSFMGITQAYKTAVWDAPFNEEYYAALARGFKTWGA